jgi:hypothetical protein
MNVLVAIANYGPYRFGYLDKMIKTFQAMPFTVDIVVHSDRPKWLPAGASLVVGLPTADPCSLPFVHKALFRDQIDNYDLFVYSEDDMLIEERNLTAFIDLGGLLPEDEIAGFFRYERADDGRVFYPDAHAPFAWVPGSVVRRGEHVFGSFSNDHSACYALTRPQLRRALRSGGYMVGAHETRYDMRASAATDPYTQCGLTKRLCVSCLEPFLVHHMPNNYAGVVGTEQDQFHGDMGRFLAADT